LIKILSSVISVSSKKEVTTKIEESLNAIAEPPGVRLNTVSLRTPTK
jgi:hypothetical protein